MRATGIGVREELELEYEESSRVGSYEDGEDDTNGVKEVKGHGSKPIDSLLASLIVRKIHHIFLTQLELEAKYDGDYQSKLLKRPRSNLQLNEKQQEISRTRTLRS